MCWDILELGILEVKFLVLCFLKGWDRWSVLENLTLTGAPCLRVAGVSLERAGQVTVSSQEPL